MKRILKQAFAIIIPIFILLFLYPAQSVFAKELSAQTSTKGSRITVTAKDGSEIGAVYVKWNKPVSPYELITDTETLSCGEYGFLHEFIALDNPSKTLVFSLPEENPMGIYSIRIFSDNQVPADVQIWQPPCERADILLISSHSDDEILFMGGIIPTYAAEQGARVQVLYMTEFWSTSPVREHEKLDGLWTDGLRTYPVCCDFKDIYTTDLSDAEKKYDLEELTSSVAAMIDRFEPQVVVTHDFNGEYGHGFHMITAKAVAAALDRANHPVSKAYFHLYPENKIRMDLNVPLTSMGGKTALDVAKEAYLQHKSQQWCWFYVSDTYKYSCADFGLYKTSVGTDENNNMLEHLVLYAEQERLEAERLEAERIEAQRLEAERLEQERIQQKIAEIQASLDAKQKEAEDNVLAASNELQKTQSELQQIKRNSLIIIIAGGFLLISCLLYLGIHLARRNNMQE